MSLESARKFLEKVDNPAGYCVPLGIDSILQHTVLPRKYYEIFAESATLGGSSNNGLSKLLKGFFNISPWPDTDQAPLATFNAFGASPQSYMPDVPYSYKKDRLHFRKVAGKEISDKQFRIRTLIKTAAERNCLVLFANDHGDNRHVSSLQLVEPGIRSGFTAQYLVRDMARLASYRLHDSNSLSGISDSRDSKPDEFTPLPEAGRHYFPTGQTSPILFILPPEPK